MIEIGIRDVKAKLDAGEPVHLLDVREAAELRICALPGAEHIPMLQLFAGLAEPEAAKDAEIVVFCHTGLRSVEAAQLLQMRGYANARSMAGGIDAWAAAFDPDMTRY